MSHHTLHTLYYSCSLIAKVHIQKRQNASDQNLSSVAFEAISGHKDKKTLLIRKHFTDEQIYVRDNFSEVVLPFLRQKSVKKRLPWLFSHPR